MMQLDAYRPVILSVTIDPTSLNSSSPSDGFIDPTSVKDYQYMSLWTGSTTAPTVNNGDTITVSGATIQFTTAGGLNLAGIVATINAYTSVHHMIAGQSSSKLTLTQAPSYENHVISVGGTASVVAAIGMAVPVVTKPYSTGPATLASSTTKCRANRRWKELVKQLSFESPLINVGAIQKPGATPDTAATSFTFYVTYQSLGAISTYDESAGGVLIKGIPAIKQMVTRALLYTSTVLDTVYDPTTNNAKSGSGPKGDVNTSITVGALASSNAVGVAAVTVALIDNLR